MLLYLFLNKNYCDVQQVAVAYHGLKVVKNNTGILKNFKLHVSASQKCQVGFYAL
jgi:hypothetical protein